MELPIEAGVMKLVDLDRCYSVHRIPAADGRELVLYNVHLSAYTSDGTIAVEQLELLRADMQAEYEKGNWCIAGGDFNKDLLGQSEEIFGGSAEGYTWRSPCRRVSGTAPICRWWLRWTRGTPSPAAATPTLRITRDSTC